MVFYIYLYTYISILSFPKRHFYLNLNFINYTQTLSITYFTSIYISIIVLRLIYLYTTHPLCITISTDILSISIFLSWITMSLSISFIFLIMHNWYDTHFRNRYFLKLIVCLFLFYKKYPQNTRIVLFAAISIWDSTIYNGSMSIFGDSN